MAIIKINSGGDITAEDVMFAIDYEASLIISEIILTTAMSLFMICSKDEYECLKSKAIDLIYGFVSDGWFSHLVLKDDSTGELIGFASFFVMNKIIGVSRLYVKPKYRNQGAATRIIGELVSSAKKAKAQVNLMCLPEMKAFYEKLGFRHAAMMTENHAPNLSSINAYCGNLIMTTSKTRKKIIGNPVLIFTDKEIVENFYSCMKLEEKS